MQIPNTHYPLTSYHVLLHMSDFTTANVRVSIYFISYVENKADGHIL